MKSAERAAFQRWEDDGGKPAPDKEHRMRLRSVLVALDLMAPSDRLLGRLARLPLAEGARVTLLHVIPPSVPVVSRVDAEHRARRLLKTEVRTLRAALPRSISVASLVKLGPPAEAISASATHRKVELIVVGRGSSRVLRDAFLGSTAERVIRQSRTPVLVVRQSARKAYQRPAAAVDFDAVAPAVVRQLLRLVPPPRPDVTVIHATDDVYHDLIHTRHSDASRERKADLRVEATAKLLGLLGGALTKSGVAAEDAPPWKLHVRAGSPRTVIEAFLRKAEPDLMATGTRAQPAAAQRFCGTVAGDILRQATCDVLVVPPR